jgi:hypothetical protein
MTGLRARLARRLHRIARWVDPEPRAAFTLATTWTNTTASGPPTIVFDHWR